MRREAQYFPLHVTLRGSARLRLPATVSWPCGRRLMTKPLWRKEELRDRKTPSPGDSHEPLNPAGFVADPAITKCNTEPLEITEMYFLGTLVHSWWECKLVQPPWKTVQRCLEKLNIELPYDPVIPLLGRYPKKMKRLIWRDVCLLMFTIALFTIAKLRRQPYHPLMDEWIKQMWGVCVCARARVCVHIYTYIHTRTMEYYQP